jgi:hypothetical protein
VDHCENGASDLSIRPNQSLQATAGRSDASAKDYENTFVAVRARSRQRRLSSFSLDAKIMSELLQRFRERFQMWHEERLDGPSGPPAGGRTARNPLSWAVLGAVVLLLPPYRFGDISHFVLPVSGFVFLAFYFSKSRFAWYVLAAELLVVTPAYIFLSFDWRLQRALHPWITWVPIVATLPIVALLFWSRKRYFTYLEQQKDHATDERI